MMRRCWILGALALWVGGSGCTTTARRTDGPMPLSSRIWGESPVPAPPQRQVSLPPEREESPTGSTASTGLSKYFPGLRRNPVDPLNVAGASRPARFSFARRSKGTQVYTTDARSGLNPGMAGASMLPVAIQVPSDRASDAAVTPARAEQVATPTDLNTPAPAPDPEKSVAKAEAPPILADTAGNPPGAGAEESHSLPPAEVPEARPAGPAVVNRMPELPAVDPRERPRLSSPAVYGASTNPQGPPITGQKSDDQATKAFPATPESSDLPILTALCRKVRGTAHNHPTAVLASPQSLPAPHPQPTQQVAPSPSPQFLETSHTCVCENCGAKIGKKPCLLKRMGKAIFHCDKVGASAPH